jgi:hypothetical protein
MAVVCQRSPMQGWGTAELDNIRTLITFSYLLLDSFNEVRGRELLFLSRCTLTYVSARTCYNKAVEGVRNRPRPSSVAAGARSRYSLPQLPTVRSVGRGKEVEEILGTAITEIGRTVRYAVGSNERTIRLGALMMLIAVIIWLVML